MKITGLSILLFLASIFDFSSAKLLGVIQVNRHGVKTGKEEPLKTNLNKQLFYNCGDGLLTINGFKQQELLGQWIRERYIKYDYKLLSENFKNEEFLIKSSFIERTIFSGVSFIKGLYPESRIKPIFEGDSKMKNDDVPPINYFRLRKQFPEVPLYIANPNYDVIFHPGGCKLDSTSDKTVNDLLVKTKIYDFDDKEIRQAIDDIKGKWKDPFINVPEDQIYNTKFLKKLEAFLRHMEYHYDRQYFKFDQSTFTMFNKLQIESGYSKRLVDSESLKLLASGFFQEFLDYLNIFSKSIDDEINNQLKYVVYSGHDGSIENIIPNILSDETLRVMMDYPDINFNFLRPQYASSFIIELHCENYVSTTNICDKTSKKFVRIIYNGENIRFGFKNGINYNEKLEGIEYDSFTNFLKSRISSHFKNLVCSISEDDDKNFLEYLEDLE